MYHRNTYTNTGNVQALIGAVVLTFVLTAVALYTPQICEGIKEFAIKGKDKATEVLHRGKKQYSVCAVTQDGKMYDTGRKVWM